jgi:aspartate 1-decarboxylase
VRVSPPTVLLWAAVKIYRDGLAGALARDERIGDVSVVADSQACREAVVRRQPKVVVIDACSPVVVEVARDVCGTGAGVVGGGGG